MLRNLPPINPAIRAAMVLSVALGIAVVSTYAASSFEVASIRPNPSGETDSSSQTQNGRFIGRNQSLRDLIEHAYDVMEWQITGPAWIFSERFDVTAKPPAGVSHGLATRDQFEDMMQNLLAERFRLQIHREQRERAVYALVVSKDGLKIAPVAGQGGAKTSWSRDHISAQHTSMARFAERLTRVADRPVVDATGVSGAFNFELKWTPDSARAKPENSPGAQLSDQPPSLFTAIEEQLGLKLEPRKAPVEMIVVDYAEKVPTEN